MTKTNNKVIVLTVTNRGRLVSNLYRMYAAVPSFFSGKLRGYLDFKRIPYENVLASAKIYKTIIIPKTGVSYIPVLETPEGEFLQDTSAIIDYLEGKHPEPSVVPESPKQYFVTRLFELFGDEWFILPAMHFRWSYPQNFAQLHRDFGTTAFPKLPGFLQSFIGRKISQRFSRFCPALGIREETGEFIEQRFETFLKNYTTHLESHPFLLGERPCVGDFSIFGGLTAHLYHDPYPKSFIDEKFSRVAKWTTGLRSGAIAPGNFLGEDAIPETLKPIISTFSNDFFPFIKETNRYFQTWAEQHDVGTKIPRALGDISITVNNQVTMQRKAITFNLWRFQSVKTAYEKLNEQDRLEMSKWLTGFDALYKEVAQTTLRIARQNNRLILAEA